MRKRGARRHPVPLGAEPKLLAVTVSDPPAFERAVALQRSLGNAVSTHVLQRDFWKNAPDAKHWHRDQRWRQYQAKKTKTPEKALGKFEEPLTSKAIEDLITTGGEKLEEAFSFYEIPKIEKIGQSETETDRALLEIQSASSKVREYLEYFNSAVDWVQRYGGEIDLGPMMSRLRGLTGEVTQRLRKVENLIDDVNDARALMRSVSKFAGAMKSGALTRENADEWIDAAEDLYNSVQPYAEAAKNAAQAGAIGGSGLAARAFLLIGFVTFEVEAGLTLLKAGKQAADKWHARNEEYLDDPWEAELRRQRRAEEAARQAEEAKRVPAKPQEPSAWKTRAEELADDAATKKRRREMELRHRWAAQRDQDRRWAIQYFRVELWPRRYKARRGQLRRTLKNYFEVMKKGGQHTGNVPLDWGDEAWVWWRVVEAAYPSDRAIRAEIERFESFRKNKWFGWSPGANRNVRLDNPTCPYYHKLYDEELDKYLASAGLSW